MSPPLSLNTQQHVLIFPTSHPTFFFILKQYQTSDNFTHKYFSFYLQQIVLVCLFYITTMPSLSNCW